MQSNTKLTRDQKDTLVSLKLETEAKGVQLLNLDNTTVMAYKDRGNTVEFSLAVMSKDEKKFRCKVGEFHALDRFFLGQTVKMEKRDFITMCEYVYDAYPL